MSITSAVSACADPTPTPTPTPTVGEQLPGPASVYLTSDPAAPQAPVDVAMTAPHDASIRFAHTFVAGTTLRGDFATSEGSYTLSALGGVCSLPLEMGPNEIVDVLLTLQPGTGCSFVVVRRGREDDPAMWKSEEPIILITNDIVGAGTPAIETVPPSNGP